MKHSEEFRSLKERHAARKVTIGEGACAVEMRAMCRLLESKVGETVLDVRERRLAEAAAILMEINGGYLKLDGTRATRVTWAARAVEMPEETWATIDVQRMDPNRFYPVSVRPRLYRNYMDGGPAMVLNLSQAQHAFLRKSDLAIKGGLFRVVFMGMEETGEDSPYSRGPRI